MYVTYIIDHIHPFLNIPKKSNVLINMSGRSNKIVQILNLGCGLRLHVYLFNSKLVEKGDNYDVLCFYSTTNSLVGTNINMIC
jgi:hypothetical protein